MTDRTGAAAISLGGVTLAGNGLADGWSVTPVRPIGGVSEPATVATVVMTAAPHDPNNTAAVDVQVQVSTSATFASTVTDVTLTGKAADGTEITYNVTSLVDGTIYYWRARAAKTGTTTWGPWSAVASFRVFVHAGDAVEYVYANVGPALTPVPDAVEYAYANVGAHLTPVPSAVEYLYANVGAHLVPVPDAVEYVYVNVDESTPAMLIWFVKPTAGRPGDGIGVYGWGFGDLQSTYSGVVEVDLDDGDGWRTVPVVSWQTFPADADGYGASRSIDPIAGEISWQYTLIEILIPADALPPGCKVRVRTDGP